MSSGMLLNSHNRLGTHRALSAEILSSGRVTAHPEVTPKRRHFRIGDQPGVGCFPDHSWCQMQIYSQLEGRYLLLRRKFRPNGPTSQALALSDDAVFTDSQVNMRPSRPPTIVRIS
jgi:hypothetical protein